MPIWGVTPQNEPGQNTTYPGMNLDAASEGRFIAQDLAPALRGAHLGTRIYGYDNNWFGGSFTFADALALNPPVARDLAGIASHCYFGGPSEMAGLHRLAPSLDELVSECSPGSGISFTTSQLEIAATRNWASAVSLWNLALNPAGGPGAAAQLRVRRLHRRGHDRPGHPDRPLHPRLLPARPVLEVHRARARCGSAPTRWCATTTTTPRAS